MGSSVLSIPAGQPLNVVINQIDPQKLDDKGAPEVYAEDGKGNHDLPEELKAAFKTMLTHYGTTVDKAARHDEVVAARRQRFYSRNYQYIYFNSNQQIFIPVVAGVTMSVGSDSVQMPRYCNVYNIYQPYLRNYSATLSQNPPGVNFEPKKQGDALDMKIAECAQNYSVHYDMVNDRRKLQAEIARLFWTDGRVVGWTRHEKNGQKFGYKPLADDAVQGAEKEENGEEVTDLYGVLEAKVFPITAKSIDKVTGVIISDDPDINRAKDDYDWIAEEIKTGSGGAGESAFERNARIGVLKGLKRWATDGDSQAHLAERHWMFLRPAAFQQCSEELEQLKQMFPEGVQVTFVGGIYAEAYPVSLDDCLTVDHPLDGDGMNRPSWGSSMMPVQDAYNNYRNMRQEYHDYGIPFTAYDTSILDINSFRQQISQPGAIVGVTLPVQGQRIADSFYAATAVSPPNDLIQAEQDLRDALSQLITAVQPALFGGKMGGDEERVGVYQMAREQAMGVMALPWGVMQGMFARFKYQAVLAAGKNRRDDEQLQVKPQGKKLGSSKPISITIADLKKGNFRAVPDTDSSFPATRAMRKAAFQEFMQASEFNPLLAEAAQQPDNLILGAELEGLGSDLDIPAARAAERQLEEIDQLLATSPAAPSQQQVVAAVMQQSQQIAMGAGAVGQKAPDLPPEIKLLAEMPPEAYQTLTSSEDWIKDPFLLSLAKSTVEVDELDFHKYHKMEIKDWLNSTERDKAMEAGNRLGVANLKLHYKEHCKFEPDPPQGVPPMPMIPPPGVGKGKPKPPNGAPGAEAQPPAQVM